MKKNKCRRIFILEIILPSQEYLQYLQTKTLKTDRHPFDTSARVFSTQKTKTPRYNKSNYGTTVRSKGIGPSGGALLRRLRRRHAARRKHLFHRIGNRGQWHLYISRLSGRHTGTARIAHRRVRISGTHRHRTRLHARRPLRRARGHERGGTQDAAVTRQATGYHHHRHRQLPGARPAKGRV